MPEAGTAATRLEVERRGPVTIAKMTHEDNRLHPDLLDALSAILDELEAGDGPAALVLTGTGKFFSNGLDLEYMSGHPSEASAILGRVQALLARILGLEVPTVAAINGHAFAAGAMLALTFDQAVMRDDRGFFCLPEAELGFPFGPGMTALIAGRLSPPVAHEAMVTARRYTAAEAVAAGIVSEAAPEDDVLDRAVARAEAETAKPRHGLAAIKRGLYASAIDLLTDPSSTAVGPPGATSA